MLRFKRTTNAFNFVFERKLEANEEIILKMPSVSPNKRGINDIGWQCETDAAIWGTVASNPESETALWQRICEYDDINKTVTGLKIKNGDTAGRIAIRLIMN